MPSEINTMPLAIRSKDAYGSSNATKKAPAKDAMVAYTRSADAAPAPALKPLVKPRRVPNSKIKMPMGPIGIAIPYPATTPRNNASMVSAYVSSCAARSTFISDVLSTITLDSEPKSHAASVTRGVGFHFDLENFREAELMQ